MGIAKKIINRIKERLIPSNNVEVSLLEKNEENKTVINPIPTPITTKIVTRPKKNLFRNVNDYNLETNTLDKRGLEGRCKKSFCYSTLDNTINPSSPFYELIKSIRSGNSSYITTVNKEIENGENIEKLSVLKKYIQFDSNAYRDACASRILNYFNTPTHYCELCSEAHPENETEPYEPILLSVDFLKKDEKYVSFMNLGYPLEVTSIGLFDWHEVCKPTLYKLIKNNFKDLSEEEMARLHSETLPQIQRELVQTYLTRVILLNDSDFAGKNYGYIINKETHEIHLAPNHDLELCFDNMDTMEDFKYQEAIEFALAKYPDILADFVSNLKTGLTPDNNSEISPIIAIINNTIPKDSDMRKHLSGVIQDRANKFESTYNLIISRSSEIEPKTEM